MENTPNRLPLKTIIHAKAWWRKGFDRQVIRCQVEGYLGESILVRPLEGNPHARYIEPADIERIEAVS